MDSVALVKVLLDPMGVLDKAAVSSIPSTSPPTLQTEEDTDLVANEPRVARHGSIVVNSEPKQGLISLVLVLAHRSPGVFSSYLPKVATLLADLLVQGITTLLLEAGRDSAHSVTYAGSIQLASVVPVAFDDVS